MNHTGVQLNHFLVLTVIAVSRFMALRVLRAFVVERAPGLRPFRMAVPTMLNYGIVEPALSAAISVCGAFQSNSR